MKYLFIIILILTMINLYGINFYPITDDNLVIVINRESIEEWEFEMIQISTTRERNGIESQETWTGIRFRDIVQRLTRMRNWGFEFSSQDNYFVRLDIDRIARFDPIIALERNSIPLEENRWRLVSPNMPEMFWISNISEIHERDQIVFPEPRNIYDHKTILNHVRLYENPEPFVNVKGYMLSDIIRFISNDYDGPIMLQSRDEISQILFYPRFLRNAVIIVVYDDVGNETFSLQCPDMPTGMWMKDIIMIQTEYARLFF